MKFGYKILCTTVFISLLYICTAYRLQNKNTDSRPTYPKTRKARLLFAGDLMQHTPQINVARRGDHFDYSDTFKYLQHHLDSADCAVINLETTVSPNQKYTGYPRFRSPHQIVEDMGHAGFDVAVLANNHCCDGGAKGIEATLESLNANKIQHTGLFRDSTEYAKNNPLLLNINGISFALLNYTYGTNGIPVPKGYIVNQIDSVVIKQDIESIDKNSIDCIIVYMHWGWEYQRKANPMQQTLARYMKELGVDLIIGSHPHVVQPYQGDSTHITLFSLGNFVSNQRKRYRDGGIIATIDVEMSPDRVMKYRLKTIPVWVRLPKYEVIPKDVGDTLQMQPWDRDRYSLFINDTGSILEAI